MRNPQDQKLTSGATNSEPGYLVTRRALLSNLGVMTLLGASGCSQALELPSLEPSSRMSTAGVDYMSTGAIPPISVDSNITDNSTMYASLTDNGFVIPAIRKPGATLADSSNVGPPLTPAEDDAMKRSTT